jgi:GTP-binding protein
MELIAVRPTPPVRAALEKALAYIKDDQLVEVTPKSIRPRKALLDRNERERTFRAKESALVNATAS